MSVIEEYRKAYRRGWNASSRYTGHELVSPLEKADSRNESNAWYDGYMDNACGRAYDPRPNGIHSDEM